MSLWVPTLRKELFEEHPVWRWDDAHDGYEPVLDYIPLPEDEPTLFLKARFKASDSTQFDGYLIGDESFYGFGAFLEEQKFVVNFNLPESLKRFEDGLRELVPRVGRIFPLRYETELRVKDAQPIEGVFG